MQFLLPFVKPNAPNTDSQLNLPSPPPDTDKSGSENDVDCDKVDTLPEMQASVQETEPAPKKSQGKKKKYELSKVDQSFIEFCEQRKKKKYDNDPRKMFLMSLLPEIHEMSYSQMKLFKRRVLVLIDDILGDMPTQHETSSSVSSYDIATLTPLPVSAELQQMRSHAKSSKQGGQEAMHQWWKTV
jgi:hypothetical protein